jgi:hypothetical protein
MAHFNCKTVERNLKLYGIDVKKDQLNCKDCIEGKLFASTERKFSVTKVYDVIEMIESDTTPFPVTSYDGYAYNIKFVCRNSGFIHTEFIRDLKSRTCLEVFRIFKAKYENLTGRRIKYIRTDGGSEYKGGFRDYLISQGITHEVSTKKYQPARAERAHRTVLELARTCHTSSKLPLKYYTDAHRYVTHTINHIIRDQHQESPYQKIYSKEKNIRELKVFGSICYIHQSKIKNTNGKLSNPGIRCRFLGYGETRITGEQNLGYKVLRECDRKVIYSPDIKFLENELIQPLENITEDLLLKCSMTINVSMLCCQGGLLQYKQ